ncbi:hypothetical protein D1841_06110 [Neglecta sp. X4]|uniref:hypothetical protein n=1 Tax=unclassified Neglectibacter TaxID=2632164 RepID=UPI0013715AB8|nr:MULTISPECIES: hypothetical protein [unclassified Neglectibacter]NBI17285.1 hypothetical protein [Neglectibacter sp. 59]NBJ72897.1 hypothetical protein [Neglectibacter sp. X4]NCE80781.1 hypothetical protein [Neglectibacter sp. X58]
MKKQGARRRPGTGAKIFLAVVTCVNLMLTLALSILRRVEVIHAIEGDEDVKLLLTTQTAKKKEK